MSDKDSAELQTALDRLIIENRNEDGNIPPPDQLAMRNEILELFAQDTAAQVAAVKVEERQFTWDLINDIRYESVSLESAKDTTLERLSTAQVKQERSGLDAHLTTGQSM
jgi:hypothetical protein